MNYFLARVAGRLHRAFAGIDREPIAHPDLGGADVLIAVWGALFGACFATLLMVAFFGGSYLNMFCGA